MSWRIINKKRKVIGKSRPGRNKRKGKERKKEEGKSKHIKETIIKRNKFWFSVCSKLGLIFFRF